MTEGLTSIWGPAFFVFPLRTFLSYSHCRLGANPELLYPARTESRLDFFPKSVTGVSDALNMKLTPDP